MTAVTIHKHIPRNDLSRENAVDVKNLRKMDQIYPKRLSCILFSLNSNLKTLEAYSVILRTKELLKVRLDYCGKMPEKRVVFYCNNVRNTYKAGIQLYSILVN